MAEPPKLDLVKARANRFTLQVFITATPDLWTREMWSAARDSFAMDVRSYTRSKTPHRQVGAVIVNPDNDAQLQLTMDYFIPSAGVELPKGVRQAPNALDYLTSQVTVETARYDLESQIGEDNELFPMMGRAFPELGLEMDKEQSTLSRPIDVVTSIRGAKLGEGLDFYFVDVNRFSPETYDITITSSTSDPGIGDTPGEFLTKVFRYASGVLDDIFKSGTLKSEEDLD